MLKNKKGVIQIVVIVVIVLVILGFAATQMREPILPVNTVQLTQQIVDDANMKFNQQNKEFVQCLKGTREGDTITFNSFVDAEILDSSRSEVIWNCPSDTIGTIHPHLNQVCVLSPSDIYSLGFTMLETVGVICNQNKIVFFTPISLEQSINVEII